MDATLQGFLDDFYARARAHDASQHDRLSRWRNLEPDSAALLALVVRAARPCAILELGTSNGYSTCWLADAASEVGATLTSVDNDPSRTAAAAETLAGAGLREGVELVTADAGEHLRSAPDESAGVVFLDAERPHYVSYWPDLRRVIARGGVLVTDNVLSHADQVADFLDLVRGEGWFSTTVATGAGLFLATRPTRARADGPASVAPATPDGEAQR